MAPSNIIKEKTDGEREQIEDVAQISQQDDRAITKWESIKGNPKTLLWIGWTVFVLCLQGFDNQAGGIVVGIEEFRKDFGNPYEGDYVLPANWQSAFSGGPTATAVFGALFASWLSDKFGRKWTIFAFLWNSVLGVALEFIATTNPVFFAGKMINGLSIGAFNTVCVAYIAEISPLPLRGVTTAMSNLSLSIGPLICTVLGAQYADLNTRWAYRGIFVAQWGFAAIALIFNPFVPESPWWLVGKGRLDEARKSLQGLGMSPVEAEKHLTYIEYTNMKAKEETEASSFTECFRGTNTRRTILTIMPLAIQAMSGVSFIATYSTYYFELAGNSVSTSFKLSCGGQGLSVAGNIISWFLVDSIGRRPLIFYGMCSLTALLMITGGLGTSANPGALTGTVAFIILYNFVFNIVIGAVAYTIISEIPTNKLRSKSISISLAVQQTLYTIQLFVLPYIFNPDRANLGAKTAFIFAAFSVLSCVYLWFFHPETANRSFREIDELFFNKVEARKFKSYITTSRMGGTGMEKDGESP